MKGYTSVEEIENYLLITIEDWFIPQIETWIEAIEAYIDKTTGRNFKAKLTTGDDFASRFYDGDSTRTLIIDDCTVVNEVTVDETVIDSEEILSYPANRTPKTKLLLKTSRFSRGNQNIEVNGRWGFSDDVPADITFAATVLVAGIVNYGNDSEGEVKSMTIGRYTVSYSDKKQWQDFEQVQTIIDSYRKQYFA